MLKIHRKLLTKGGLLLICFLTYSTFYFYFFADQENITVTCSHFKCFMCCFRVNPVKMVQHHAEEMFSSAATRKHATEPANYFCTLCPLNCSNSKKFIPKRGDMTFGLCNFYTFQICYLQKHIPMKHSEIRLNASLTFFSLKSTLAG